MSLPTPPHPSPPRATLLHSSWACDRDTESRLKKIVRALAPRCGTPRVQVYGSVLPPVRVPYPLLSLPRRARRVCVTWPARRGDGVLVRELQRVPHWFDRSIDPDFDGRLGKISLSLAADPFVPFAPSHPSSPSLSLSLFYVQLYTCS